MIKAQIHILVKPGQEYDEQHHHLQMGNSTRIHVTTKKLLELRETVPLGNDGTHTDQKEWTDKLHWVYALVNTKVPSDLRGYEKRHQNKGDTAIFGFPDFLRGGGMAWLEPFYENEMPPQGTTPHGCYISALGQPRIIKALWTDRRNNEIKGPVRFGSKVRLHIYTADLYGQELQITLLDNDFFSPDDNLYLTDNRPGEAKEDPHIVSTSFRREVDVYDMEDFEEGFQVKGGPLIQRVEGSQADATGDNTGEIPKKRVTHIQKTVLDVFVDPYWMISGGNDLSIFPKIKIETTGEIVSLKKEALEVKHDAPEYKDPDATGNIPVVVGRVQTNVRAFDPCRYDHIHFAHKDRENVLFDEQYQVNAGKMTIPVGILANNTADKLTITVKTVHTEPCFEEEDPHTNRVIDTTALTLRDIDFTYKEAANTTLSFVPQYPYEHISGKKHDLVPFFFNYFPLLNDVPALLPLPVNSCAYRKKLALRIYPDVAFSYHLFIGEPSDDFDYDIHYRDIRVKLIKGLKNEIDWARKQAQKADELTKYFPIGLPNNIVRALVYDYLEAKANSFQFGMHGYHTFEDDKPVVMDYTREYPFVAKLVIGVYVVLAVAVDALLLFLMRGKNLPAILRTIRNVKRVGDFAAKKIEGGDRDNVELLWPNISATRGIGYEADDQGQVALILRENVAAAPLFGIRYKVEETLGSFAARMTGITKVFDTTEKVVGLVGKIRWAKKLTNWLESKAGGDKKPEKGGVPLRPSDAQELLNKLENTIHMELNAFAKKYGQEAKLVFRVDGKYNARYDLAIDLSNSMMRMDIYEDNGQVIPYKSSSSLTFGKLKGIAVEAQFEASSEFTIALSKAYHYAPDFLKNYVEQPEDINIKGEAHVRILGSVHFERTYSLQKGSEPTFTDITIFSGLLGMMSVYIETKGLRDDTWSLGKKKESLENKEDILLTILPSLSFKSKPQKVFDRPNTKNANEYFR